MTRMNELHVVYGTGPVGTAVIEILLAQGKQVRAITRALLPLLGLVIPTLRGLEENLYIGYEPYIVDHSAYAQAFGDHATPLREAIRATVQWCRSHTAAGWHTPAASTSSNR